MTDIKKFGFGVIAAALFAMMAFATLVGTAHADVDTLDVSNDLVEAGTDVTVTATLDAEAADGDTITFRILGSSDGEGELGDAGVQTLTCTVEDDAAGPIGDAANPGDCDDGTAEVDLADAAVAVVFTVTLDTQVAGDVDLSATHDGVGALAQVTIVGEVDPDAVGLEIDAPAAVEAGDEDVEVTVTAVDENGDGVEGVSIDVDAEGADADTAPVVTDADGEAVFTFDVDDDADGVVLTFFTGVGSIVQDDLIETVAIAVAGDAASITVDAPATVAVGGTAEVSATVLDADGDPVPGATVTFVASVGAVAGCDATTNSSGEADCTYVAPTDAQTAQITVVSAGAVGTAMVSVSGTGTVDPGTDGDGTFASAPNFSANGVGSAVFNGGTIEQLAAATTAAGGTGVWVQGNDGNWYRYSIGATGATAFVNNAFNTQFAGGFSGAVAVFVVQ